MALASVISGKVLNVTLDGSTDWTWDIATHGWVNVKSGVKINKIMWFPNATSDAIVIRDGGSAGPIIFKAVAVDNTDQRVVYYYGDSFRPVAYASEVTGADQVLCIILD